MAYAMSPDQLVAMAEQVAADLQQQGFAVIESFLSEEQLEELRLESDTLYEVAQEEQHLTCSAAGGSSSGVRWGREAAVSCIYESIPGHCCTPQLRTCHDAYKQHRSRWPLRPGVWHLLCESHLSRLMAALLGPGAVLFNDQYILKPPGSKLSSFQWHRDSDWCRSGEAAYSPYLSVWCALDDMTSLNGCFIVHPGSHLTAPESPDEVPTLPAARGQQQQPEQQPQQPQGLPLEVRAGTAIITSDTVLHCSGPNHSCHMRRAWMPQYSARPLTWHATGSCVSLAIPLQPQQASGTV